MVISKKKREKVRQLLAEDEKWEIIKAKTGVCYDTINRIRKESLSSTNPQLDKTRRVHQDLSKKKQQPTTPNNTPDSNVLRLEKKIDNVGQTLLTHNQHLQNVEETLNQLKPSQPPQETTDPHQRKPDNEPNPPELPHQEMKNKSFSTMTPTVQPSRMNSDQANAPPPEIKVNPLYSLNPTTMQISEVDLDSTDEPPQERKKEYLELQPYHIKAVLEIFREIKKQYDAYQNYKKTGVYICPPKKEKIEEPRIREFVIPILEEVPKSEKPPHNNSDSDCSIKTSNDEVNTNFDQIPSKKKDQPS